MEKDFELNGDCKQLGTEHIATYSPQARGRSECVLSMLQD